ncbi:MAG: alpha/beta hydrolase [Microgenomates group bacterium]
MKLALLLPGYLDSPDYLHMKVLEKGLQELGYIVEILDACNLWKTGDVKSYTITNYIQQIRETIRSYKEDNPEEVILVGHSNGGFTSIVAAVRIPEVTKVVALCPPPNKEGSEHKWVNGVRISERDLPDDPSQSREFAVPYSHIEDALKYSAIEDVKKIHKPLMIFIALDDIVVLPEWTEGIVANANNPYVVRQEGMGHDFRKSKEQCEIVMKEVEKFLQEK